MWKIGQKLIVTGNGMSGKARDIAEEHDKKYHFLPIGSLCLVETVYYGSVIVRPLEDLFCSGEYNQGIPNTQLSLPNFPAGRRAIEYKIKRDLDESKGE